MRIQNLATTKFYTISRDKWNTMGKNQKLFKVIDDTDNDAIEQPIENLVAPPKGDKPGVNKNSPDSKNTTRKQTTSKTQNKKP